jgi:hypothetical protein
LLREGKEHSAAFADCLAKTFGLEVSNFNSTNAPQFAEIIALVPLSTATAVSSIGIGPCPGSTATDLNHFQCTRTVEPGRGSRCGSRSSDRSNGHFSDENGVILR